MQFYRPGFYYALRHRQHPNQHSCTGLAQPLPESVESEARPFVLSPISY